MASLNKVMLIGACGKDPEVRQFQDGGSVCNFTLATTDYYTDRSGQRQESTEWHNIVLNGKLANLSQYIRKGSKLYVEGKIRTRSWQDQSGQKHYSTEIVALGIQLLDPKTQTPAQPQAPQAPHAPQTRRSVAPPPAPSAPVPPAAPAYDDDMPF